MVPSADLQLQVVIKALGEAIAPAVDPANKVAIEQLHLSIATLSMLRTQLPMTRRFLRAVMADAIDLGEALCRATDADARRSLEEGLEAARAVLSDPAAENEKIESARADLTDRTVKLIASAERETQSRFEKLVLDLSGRSLERFRAWFSTSGFEPVSAHIRPISELIA